MEILRVLAFSLISMFILLWSIILLTSIHELFLMITVGKWMSPGEHWELARPLEDELNRLTYLFCRDYQTNYSKQIIPGREGRFRVIQNLLWIAQNPHISGFFRRCDIDPVHGELYRRGSKGGKDVIQFLIVRCPSTHQTHILLVPSKCRTALQARAWTFSMKPEEFKKLKVET